MKDVIRFIVILTIILGIAFGGYLFVMHTIDTHTYAPMEKNASVDDYVALEISPGMSASEVIDILYQETLIRNSTIANLLVRFHGWGAIQAGEYQLHSGLSLYEMFSMFQDGDVAEGEYIYVIIPEGALLTWIAHLFGEALEINSDYLLELWSDVDFLTELIEEYWFLTDEILSADILYPLEGYFYPIRHAVPKEFEDAREVTRTMLNMTENRLSGIRSQIEAHDMTFHEMLAFAAIIEAETQEVDEMENVAGVFNNRMEIGQRLETDVTVQYVSPERSFHVTAEMLAIDSPFNTYRYHGLPPGPVNSPSRYAMMAAMEPAEHEYFFFISDMFGCVGEVGNKNYFTNFADHYEFYREYLRPSYDAGYSVCNPDVTVN